MGEARGSNFIIQIEIFLVVRLWIFPLLGIFYSHLASHI